MGNAECGIRKGQVATCPYELYVGLLLERPVVFAFFLSADLNHASILGE